MAAVLGLRLESALAEVTSVPTDEARARVESMGGTAPERLPVFLAIPPVEPEQGGSWRAYRRRVLTVLRPIQAELAEMGIEADLLIAANLLRLQATPEQIERLRDLPGVRLIELDPLLNMGAMAEVVQNIDLPVFLAQHPTLDGSGVRVAVLDGGIDLAHPFLQVAASRNLTAEGLGVAGLHATHCAGIIGSRHPVFRGVAPAAELINVKVTTANLSAPPTLIAAGIDAAMGAGARVLSISLGLNHIPPIAPHEGHGWVCHAGDCPLCLAADIAEAHGAVIVAAAGNEHRAVQLFETSTGQQVSSEIRCPGQARGAITVGALTKRPYVPDGDSSHGPTVDGRAKPDLSAPGVGVRSTVPVPAVQPVTEDQLFGVLTGTSIATPVVAAAVALVRQRRMAQGAPVTPAAIRQEILSQGLESLGLAATIVGRGVINLRQL